MCFGEMVTLTDPKVFLDALGWVFVPCIRAKNWNIPGNKEIHGVSFPENLIFYGTWQNGYFIFLGPYSHYMKDEFSVEPGLYGPIDQLCAL